MKKFMLVFVPLLVLSARAQAQSLLTYGFEGWCASTSHDYEGEANLHDFANEPYGVRVTTQGFNFSTGEEGASCSFSNPTPVRDFDATLFDASCWSPYASAIGQDYLLPRRAMLQTSIDEGTGEARAFLIMPNNIIVPSVVEELRPCLSFKHSDMHSELGYKEGFYQPDLNTPDVQGIAEILSPRWGVGGAIVDGRLQEAVGMEPNFAGHFIIGTMGGCGTDCSIPFIFDTRDGREIKLTLSNDPNAEYGNFSFSMINDRGDMIVSWRDHDCVRQEFSLVDSTLELTSEIRTPYDMSLWSGYPLHCPAPTISSKEAENLAAQVLAVISESTPSELAPTSSVRPQPRPAPISERTESIGVDNGSETSFNPQTSCVYNRPTDYGGTVNLVQCIGATRFALEKIYNRYDPLFHDREFIQHLHRYDQLCGYDGGIDLPVDFKLSTGEINMAQLIREMKVGTTEQLINTCNAMIRAATPK